MNGSHRQGTSPMAPRARGLFLLVLLTLVGLLVGLLGGGSEAGAAADKVTICHATSSEKNPYVMITVSTNAWDGEGKNDHKHHDGDALAVNDTCPDGNGPGGGPGDEVTLCHVTGSETNRVVEIEHISESGLQNHLENHPDDYEPVNGSCDLSSGPPPPDPNTEGDPNKAPASATVTETAAVQGAAPSRQAARVCTSRRSFRIRIRSKRRDPVVGATVSVNGKRVASRKGTRVTAPVVLRGLAKGTYAVKITATTRRGRKLSGTRRYKTCAPKSQRKSIPLL